MELELIHQHPQKMKFKHPLLFLHGAFSGAWCWKENYLDYFASQGFECLALSLRGHGESKSHMPLDRLSLRDYQENIFPLSVILKNPLWSSGIRWEPICFNRSSNLKKFMVPC